MKKNNTDGLLTMNFGWACAANFLLFASVYLMLPLLPLFAERQQGISLVRPWLLYLLFLGGMLLVGPFHAYLGDAYKRKGVLMLATLGVSLTGAGYLFADTVLHLSLLVLLQGACFALASTAGMTVAIDITPSARRTAGNRVYAWAARLGMFLAVMAVFILFPTGNFRMLAWGSSLSALLGFLSASLLYVPFRAPIGLGVCSLDRFILPRAWLPGLNLLLIAFVSGLLLPLFLLGDGCWGMLPFVLLLCLTTPFIRMFVRLSHHCQRGTANSTCHLSVEAGLLLGFALADYLIETVSPSLGASFLYTVAGMVLLFALALWATVTMPYYRRMRVR